MKKILFSSFLIILAILFRTQWHLGPNIEFVTTASFLAATYLGKKWSILVPLLIMVISDKFIGNTSIYLFTWSAFIFIGLTDFWFLKKFGHQRLILKQTGAGLFSSLFFFFYTNFGVWFLDFFGMYPRTFSGLTQCYFNGLPFLKNNLLGNLFFIPISFFLIEFSYGIIYSCKKLFLVSRSS